ncbi:hypothetical protein Scep_012558 [Stephania cephalantha]|uniref:Uncharacterized protein n=1 Tax=Stephania cephalantha TaxID=152367 RepID=A0AAP0P9N4_9MAGN
MLFFLKPAMLLYMTKFLTIVALWLAFMPTIIFIMAHLLANNTLNISSSYLGQ